MRLSNSSGELRGVPFIPDLTSKYNIICSIIHRFGRAGKLDLLRLKAMAPESLGVPGSALERDLISMIDRQRDVLTFGKSLIRSLVPIVKMRDLKDINEWLEGTGYSGERIDYLKNLRNEIRTMTPKDLINKSFLKEESYPAPKNPRSINSFTDESKVCIGALVNACDKALFSLTKFFVKNEDVAQRPVRLLETFGEKRVFLTDFTSFESHHRYAFAELMRYRFAHQLRGLKDTCIGCGQRAMILNMIMGRQKCIFRGVTAELDETLMSGAMFTSSNNGLLNLIITSYLVLRSKYPLMGPEELGSRVGAEVTGVFEGDDGLFVSDHDPRPLIATMGIDIKLVEHKNFGTAAFCGVVCPIRGVENYVRQYGNLPEDCRPNPGLNITCPKKFLKNVFVISRKYMLSRDQTHLALIRAKALSYKYAYGNCPIVGPLCDRILDHTRSVDVRSFRSEMGYNASRLDRALETKIWKQRANPSDEARQIVATLFGIDLDMQHSIEASIAYWDGGLLAVPECLWTDLEIFHSENFSAASLAEADFAFPSRYTNPLVAKILATGELKPNEKSRVREKFEPCVISSRV